MTRSSNERCVIFGRLGLLALAGALNAGCGGPTLIGEQTSAVSIGAAAISSAPEAAAPGEPQGGLGVARAFVSVAALTLVPCLEDAASITLAPRSYELIDSTASDLVTTAVTELCALELTLAPSARSTEGVPEGASLYVEGQAADGTPFALSSDAALSLTLEAEAGESFGQEPLLLGFDLATWLAELDLEDEPAASAALAAQLAQGVALYTDADGDRQLDEDAPAPVAIVR